MEDNNPSLTQAFERQISQRKLNEKHKGRSSLSGLSNRYKKEAVKNYCKLDSVFSDALKVAQGEFDHETKKVKEKIDLLLTSIKTPLMNWSELASSKGKSKAWEVYQTAVNKSQPELLKTVIQDLKRIESKLHRNSRITATIQAQELGERVGQEGDTAKLGSEMITHQAKERNDSTGEGQKYPAWVREVATKVHKWRGDPAKFDRFLKQIQAYFVERTEAQKKWENGRENYFSKIPKDSPLRDSSKCPQDLNSCSKKESCSKNPADCFKNQNFCFDYCGDITLNEKSDWLIPSEVWIPVELSPEAEPRRRKPLPLESRKYPLNEKYLTLFLLHDVISPQGEENDPYTPSFTNPYGLEHVEEAAIAYAVWEVQAKDYLLQAGAGKTRIEWFLDDVEKDLEKKGWQEGGAIEAPPASEEKDSKETTEQKNEPAKGGGNHKGEEGFVFVDGQVLFNGKDLELPSGLPVDVLKMLHNSFGRTVTHSNLHPQSTCSEASPELREAIGSIRISLKKHKIKAEVKSKRSVGYLLQ